jgi:hypothetical protein
MIIGKRLVFAVGALRAPLMTFGPLVKGHVFEGFWCWSLSSVVMTCLVSVIGNKGLLLSETQVVGGVIVGPRVATAFPPGSDFFCPIWYRATGPGESITLQFDRDTFAPGAQETGVWAAVRPWQG